MPPIRKFTKEDIIEIAKNLVEKEGMESINARRIAKELHASVQPIFHNFKNMEDLKKEVYNRIYDIYKKYMDIDLSEEKSYKKIGLAYIDFAAHYPEFFKIIFMQQTNLNVENFMMADYIGDSVIKAGQILTGLSYEEQKKFHIKVWIFTHGIACLVATKTIKITNAQIDELLENTVFLMLKGYQLKKEEKNEKNN